jgi:nicotinate-nucleotide pyrophosphorylase (carboxylating)
MNDDDASENRGPDHISAGTDGASSDWLHPPAEAVREAVRRALAEDLLPLGDLTASLLPESRKAAHIVARGAGTVAGSRCVTETFSRVDPDVVVNWWVSEGTDVGPGEPLATVHGSLRSVVTAERTALNFLGHLSGVATLTAQFVKAASAAGGARIWDTRKTTPGLRSLEKAAVRSGGGRNHRGNLSDWLLIKDNHLEGLSITDAVALARDRWPGRTVHVECDTVEQCTEALAASADAILLDNMPPALVRRCVELANEAYPGGRRPLLEVSGGVDLDTVGGYSACGVDQISVGAITNSAPVLDIGLDI